MVSSTDPPHLFGVVVRRKSAHIAIREQMPTVVAFDVLLDDYRVTVGELLTIQITQCLYIEKKRTVHPILFLLSVFYVSQVLNVAAHGAEGPLSVHAMVRCAWHCF